MPDVGEGGMRGGSRRGSYFFVIDAFIAGAILVFTLVMIFNLFIAPRETEQSFTYAHDYLSFLTSTQVRDYHDLLVDNLVVPDRRKTLAEQVLIFHNASNDSAAAVILGAAAQSLPSTVALNISLKDGVTMTMLYNRSIDQIPAKRSHLVAKSIGYAIINQSALYGPLTLQVEVWS